MVQLSTEAPNPEASRAAPPLPTLLVVDDDEYVRRTIRQALRGIRAHIVEAASAAEALEIAALERPSVALLDLGLPDLDGHDLAERLRLLLDPQPIRIMILTAQLPNRKRLAAVGADGFLAKPFRLGELNAAVLALLPTL